MAAGRARSIVGLFVVMMLAPAVQGGVDHLPQADPDHVLEGVLSPQADCQTLILPPDSGGKAFHVYRKFPAEAPYNQAATDYIVIFDTTPSTDIGVALDASGASLGAATVFDVLTGGGSGIVESPTREYGQIPDGASTITVCVKGTLAAYLRYYRFYLPDVWTRDEPFVVHIGGLFHTQITATEVDVVTFPGTEGFNSAIVPTAGTPAQFGHAVLPTLPGYTRAEVRFASDQGPPKVWLKVCGDRNGDGLCSPDEPFRQGCVGTSVRTPSPLQLLPLSGNGERLIFTVGHCGPVGLHPLPLNNPVGQALPEGAASSKVGETGVNHYGQIWMTMCRADYTGPCEPYFPIDLFPR